MSATFMFGFNSSQGILYHSYLSVVVNIALSLVRQSYKTYRIVLVLIGTINVDEFARRKGPMNAQGGHIVYNDLLWIDVTQTRS